VVGSTGRWPQVVNIWEYDSWDDLAHNFEVELVGSGHRDPMLEEWWTEAAKFRTGGEDRILVAHHDSPGIEQWCARGGTGAVAYLHETTRTSVGAAPLICDELVVATAEQRRAQGLELVGAFRVAMRADDEVLAIWAVPDWATWARVEAATDAAAAITPDSDPSAAGVSSAGPILSLERLLLVDAELSPLRIGRQPIAADRRSLDEF